MVLHVFDGDRWTVAPDLDTARSLAQEAIGYYRDNCDPEWSDSVEYVGVYDAPEGDEDPSEHRCLLIATMSDQRDDPTGQCDYWCDYELSEPTKEGRSDGA